MLGISVQRNIYARVKNNTEYPSNDTTTIEKQTCPLEPYAVYTKFPFSTFPPHFRMAEARNVALTAPCAT